MVHSATSRASSPSNSPPSPRAQLPGLAPLRSAHCATRPARGCLSKSERRVSAVKLRGMPADTDHISAILMERHAEHEPCARRDWGSAMLDRLQSYDATRANETVASAEQHRIAEAEHDFPAERLSSFGRIAEQELASLKALCVWVLQVDTRAQDNSQLDREEHRATQIAVQGI